ncbi:right-handed parallel beta-helix repeat-containing protein [Aureibacter tunicatorum]|uniref:Right handed beta helix domain-containing protein n=1 Tax=Aureibacter tunicatorum TaxID=866807 RepID=A0AAE3XPX7_9BACT|nr:right-handed parallel beta-helix repeat-containing protein [Aureibacter tunicatorum]MDR6240543.1 hypothetical protein [Aureibacter tunicatorum]BDD06596.1 hypothetical protein AUTU_40790 [Aureibacter tunicatorum]
MMKSNTLIFVFALFLICSCSDDNQSELIDKPAGFQLTNWDISHEEAQFKASLQKYGEGLNIYAMYGEKGNPSQKTKLFLDDNGDVNFTFSGLQTGKDYEVSFLVSNDAGTLAPKKIEFSTRQVYVDPEYGNTGKGTSWRFPLSNMQQAVDLAHRLSKKHGVEFSIWCKKGLYNLADETIVLYDSTQIYGGFAGDEMDVDQRDYNVNISLATGRKKNATLFLGLDDIQNFVLIDGFNFTSSYVGDVSPSVDGEMEEMIGGAVRFEGVKGDLIVRNCNFFDNQNDLQSSGLVVVAEDEILFPITNVYIENCQFMENTGSRAALSIYFADNVVFDKVRFYNNKGIDEGGAALLAGVQTFYVDEGVFVSNKTEYSNGSCLYLEDVVKVDIEKTEFVNNITGVQKLKNESIGGLLFQENGTLSITSSKFVRNDAYKHSPSLLKLQNVSFSDRGGNCLGKGDEANSEPYSNHNRLFEKFKYCE